MKILYFDCPSGICGDMVLSAFIDLGIDIKELNAQIEKLKLPEKSFISAEKKTIRSLTGSVATVQFNQDKKSKQRSYSEIKTTIEKADLHSFVKEKSLEMFYLIGAAESNVHKIPLEDIHFHEIGAVDSITDIVGVAVCFWMLLPFKAFFSALPVGSGGIKSEHGILPSPAPAAVEILNGIPIYGVDIQDELVTPTGAAIVKSFANGFAQFPPMVLEKVGTGLSKKKFESLPPVLRIFSGLQKTVFDHDTAWVIESNIDNFNPEFYGHIQDILFQRGALDVALTPIIMKKGRPGHILSVICNTHELETLIDAILTETPTAGLRYHETARRKLKREIVSVETPYGTLKVKKVFLPDGERLYPEYEDLKKIANEKNIPIQKLFIDILASLNKPK